MVTVKTINKQVFKYLLTDAASKLNGRHQCPILAFMKPYFKIYRSVSSLTPEQYERETLGLGLLKLMLAGIFL